jgi:hypothetical protein
MQVETIEVMQEEAEKQSRLLKKVFKDNASIAKNEIYRNLQRAYGHMKHGGKVIDVYEAFKDTGIGPDSNPRIAIVRADAMKCYMTKLNGGGAVFSHIDGGRWGTSKARKTYGEIELPKGTFGWDHVPWDKSIHSTIVPVIPPAILIEEVKHHLRNYYILWEVEDWKMEPPRDPLLLKKITPNLFAILATWDLSDLERAIIKSFIIT